MAETGPRAACTVLVTRPAGQQAALGRLLEAAGVQPLVFPTLCIEPAGDPAALAAVLQQLPQADLAVFVSANAVEQGLRALAPAAWPAGPVVAAVGPSTAAALQAHGLTATLVPEHGADTEALLALPGLQALAGRHVIIFRGEGGREALAEGLRARGARVTYAQCYRRVLPVVDPAPLLARWQAGGIDAVACASAESYRNLGVLLGPAGGPLLRATPLFVPHPRVAATARGLGAGEVIVTGPGDAALVAAIRAHQERRAPASLGYT